MANSRKVLIAEDSSVIQNITKKVLQFQNYEIDIAKNGKQVLEKMKKEDYAIILLDINMPQMDGMECARRIRSLEDKQKAATPIIAITGNAKNYSMDDFRAAGINDYMSKPVDFDLLIEKIGLMTEEK